MIRRGEIYWVDFGDRRGSAPAFHRPAVVVSTDEINASRIQTVIVAAVTANTDLAAMPGNVLVPASQSGLPTDSVVNVSSLGTVDKRSVDAGPAGALPPHLMRQVDDGVRLILGL